MNTTTITTQVTNSGMPVPHFSNWLELTQGDTTLHAKPKTAKRVCQLESIDYLDSKTEMGYVFFVKQIDGSHSQLKWQWSFNETKNLPEIGSSLLIEHELPRLIHNQEMALIEIIDWQAIQPYYDHAYLQMLFNEVENEKYLINLLDIIAGITDERLQKLLMDIFNEPTIALPFVKLPASHNHHHSYSGGLLQHSVECAQWIDNIARTTLTPIEAELSITAALLHDLGKIETMSHSYGSQIVSHEIMTLALIEPLLSELQQHWKSGAHALREMLSSSPSNAKFPKLPGTLLIKMADQYSTSLSARDMAFTGQPDYYYWASLKTPTSVQFFNRIS